MSNTNYVHGELINYLKTFALLNVSLAKFAPFCAIIALTHSLNTLQFSQCIYEKKKNGNFV